MIDNLDASMPNQEENNNATVADYLKRAKAACDEGDEVLGVHLYLAAFEEEIADARLEEPSRETIGGLKEAWVLACNSRERSLAEYIFEKMEPYLNSDEIAICADELQNLALDKLEEFGLTRDDLEEMAQIITEDFLNLDSPVLKVEHIMHRKLPAPGSQDEPAEGERENDHEGSRPCCEGGCARSSEGASDREGKDADTGQHQQHRKSDEEVLAEAASFLMPQMREKLDYTTLAGYDSTVRVMRDLGIGMQEDEQFQQLVRQLNARHGLDRMPALDTLLFRAPVREDANRFVAATIGEIGLPVLRMYMEENLQGMPLLCVTAQADNAPRLNSLRNAFEGGGILVLDDIDLWGAPPMEPGEDQPPSFLAMQLSRGAREAMNLVRSAVDNPDVYVFATASCDAEIDPYFLDMLEPISIVDIDYPTPEERIDIWMDIAREHPSIRSVNQADLVRYSANMPRFDMYMAAREAVEEAYKMGLMARHYRPVTSENLFEKLAAYQPLESREYHELEEAVIRDFRNDLDDIEDLLKGA